MSLRKSRLFVAAAIGAAVLLPSAAQAAKNWVLSSTNVLSGANAWVTVDAASSDELYFPNLRPLALDTIEVLDADGQVVAPQNPSAGKFRSTFDVQVTKPGTWRISSVSSAVMASWTENGEVKRFRGSAADFAKQVPAGAADLKTIRTVSRNETFVTRDNPTTTVFKTSGQGIELVPVTHPTDVIVGEPAKFRLLLDGKPAANVEVEAIADGIRYRNSVQELTAKTGADGVFSLDWQQAGLYWISASVQDDKGEKPAKLRRFSYTATLEVLSP